MLAIDQRRGGERFGGANRTISHLGEREFSYCEVYPDLEAALEYGRSLMPGAPIAAWGSSYSAALTLRLAAAHAAEIAGVLAFSPASGDPLEGCRPERYARSLTMPVLVLRPAREAEIPSVATQLEDFRSYGHRTYVAQPGTHGSSMLVADRVGGPVEETWAEVLAFLEHVVTTQPAR